MQSPMYESQPPGFRFLRWHEYRFSHLQFFLVIKERSKTKTITQKHWKHFFSQPHGTATCRATVVWGQQETQCIFHLISGEGATTGGYFKI